MGKIYRRDHVVYCEIKKIITVTVELQDPSNSQVEKMINDISKQLEDVSLTKETDIAALKKNHAAEVEQLKESHESMLLSVQTKFALERKAAEEATEAMKIAMQTTINSQHSELEELNGRLLELNSKVSVLNSSISEKEAALATLRKENDVLKDEVTSERNRKEHLDANNLRLSQKICDLETDLTAERKKNSLIDAELIHQREKVRVTIEDSQRKGKHLEKTEKLLKQQTAEIAKANSIIKQLQRELKNSQTKAKLRGQVATEQEKVLTSKELELEDLQQKMEQLKTQVSAEKRQREEGQAKLLQVESALEEAQKTIKSNENIINWLNRQISESYSTSLHNRLKSSGIPVPGANDGFFDLSKPRVPFDGGANSIPALKPTFTAAPFPPLSVTSLTALTSTAGEGLLSTGKGQTTNCRSPSVPPCSSGSAAPQTNSGLVLVAAGESSLSRPPVLLSTTDKSQASAAHTTTSPREFSTAAPDASKPSSRPSQGATADFKFVSSYPLPPKPRTLGYGDLPGFDRRAASGLESQSVSCDEKQHQSLTSSFFPQTNTAR
ncbi:hypothetical protein AAHC03_016686 [Spirometra sp. Aus1]